MKNRLKMAMAAAEMLYSGEGGGEERRTDDDGKRQMIKKQVTGTGIVYIMVVAALHWGQ